MDAVTGILAQPERRESEGSKIIPMTPDNQCAMVEAMDGARMCGFQKMQLEPATADDLQHFSGAEPLRLPGSATGSKVKGQRSCFAGN